MSDAASAEAAATPYWRLSGFYLLRFAAATAIAFAAPQTWDWTRKLPAWKCGLCLALLWASLALLTSQAYNPFIYFIF